MDPFALPPLAALLDLSSSALLALGDLLTPLAGSASAAAAIVLVTLLVRAVLLPTGIAQARAEQTRARLAPRLRELQRRHKKNPERLQRETMQLYRDEKASPFGGCLPLLVQAPVVGLLYTLFLRPEIAGHPNMLLAHDLAGVPLGTSLVGAIGSGAVDPAMLAVFGALIAIMLITAEASRRLLRPPAAEDPSPLASPGVQRAMGMLHYLTAVFALVVPLAAGLYLTVTVVWTLGQRLILRRRFPLP